MAECATCNNGELLPQYGVAPHDCFYKLGKSMGQSVTHPRDSWPSNFELDAESNGQCGIFHCPDCGPRFRAGLPVEPEPERDTKTIDMFEASE
ncbi:TPA: hypothetical protein ACKE3D_002125 [Burkholderia dolosa]